MHKTEIPILLSLLQEAQAKGCKKIKLQLYDNWEQVAKEQKNPSQKIEEYQIDTRFYNTIEFETEVKDMQATDRLISKIEGDTLILRVSISDRDSLLRNLGIEEFYDN